MLPYTTYLIDLDGVIYRGNELLHGAKEFIFWLETNHKKYLFLTNNSFATGTQIRAKLERLGIATDNAHLLTAGQAAVQNIARRIPQGVVYVVGEQPLIDLVEKRLLSYNIYHSLRDAASNVLYSCLSSCKQVRIISSDAEAF